MAVSFSGSGLVSHRMCGSHTAVVLTGYSFPVGLIILVPRKLLELQIYPSSSLWANTVLRRQGDGSQFCSLIGTGGSLVVVGMWL